MIPTFDLRTGNWIIASDVIHKIVAVAENKVKFADQKGSFNPEDLQPIPLTPEILEKAGLKQRGKSSLYDKVPEEGFTYHIYWHRIMLFHAPDNTLSHWLNTRIVFLHQLQNLYYYLTGREIQISF